MNQKKKVLPRYSYTFTLLEMMIALLILSLVGAVSAVPIHSLINSHRFEGEISHLFIELQEAQVLAAVYQTDIALDLYREKGKLHYRFSTNEPFTTVQLNREAKQLTYTDSIEFQGKKINVLHFDIFSGRLEPGGILTFRQTPKEDSKRLWIDMQYDGLLLKFSHQKPLLSKRQIPAQP